MNLEVAETAEQYHASEGVSNSKLSDFIDDPALYFHYHVAKDWQRPPPSDDMLYGTAIHEMMPPGECTMVVIPDDALNDQGHCKGAAWKQFATENAGKTLVKKHDAERYLEPIKAARANPEAMRFLQSPLVEHVIRWREYDLDLRAMLDRLNPEFAIADIKTTRATTAKEFAAEIYRNGYHRQAAFYKRAAFSLVSDDLPFVFIACRKSRPYTVEVYEIDEAFINEGNREIDAALDDLKRCQDTGIWQRPSAGKILTLSMPAWAKYENQWSLNNE